MTQDLEYLSGKSRYQLENTPVSRITQVKGWSRGQERVFEEGTDYRLSRDSLEWLANGLRPDEGSRFSVHYAFSRPFGLSDVSSGSVIRTITEAIGREIDYLYSQMDHMHISGFLDTATGEALDMVVAILGMKRKPPQPSSGLVTFGRGTPPESLTTTGEVHLFDGSLECSLKKPAVGDIIKVEGTVSGAAHVFQRTADYDLVEGRLRWLPEGMRPDSRTVFRIDYTSFAQIPVPKGSAVAVFSPRPEEAISFTTTEEVFLKPLPDGRWEADAPVICQVAGPRGNVLAGAITVMPQPVQGIEYVINKGDITNGVEQEGDQELRERARHALELAGRATLPSLESAVRAVEGVRSLLIEDMPDNVPGIVRVIVDGGDPDEIMKVINETRAAGIKVEFLRPKTVYIDASMVLTLPKHAVPAQSTTEAERLVRSYISSCGIGEDVLFSRIIDAALAARDVADVTQVSITAYKETEIIESQKENITVTSLERAEPRKLTIDCRAKPR